MVGMTDQIIIYQSPDGTTGIEVHLEAETVWLNQKQMAELFGKDVRTINEHVKNVFKEKELTSDSTVRKFRIVQKEGKRNVERDLDFFNLDVIISIGYRVKSQRGTRFRQWATKILRDNLIQGFTVNASRIAEKGLTEMQQAVEKLLSWGHGGDYGNGSRTTRREGSLFQFLEQLCKGRHDSSLERTRTKNPGLRQYSGGHLLL
jgi:hypothetical protein